MIRRGETSCFFSARPDLLGVVFAPGRRALAFGNAARFYTDTNPQFFHGTVIERDVDELLRADVDIPEDPAR